MLPDNLYRALRCAFHRLQGVFHCVVRSRASTRLGGAGSVSQRRPLGYATAHQWRRYMNCFGRGSPVAGPLMPYAPGPCWH
jgi:hypothetical protein